MTDQTETPTPSAQDDIKSVLQDAVIQHTRALLKYTSAEGFALQIPDTDTLVLAGPLARIAEFIGREIADPSILFDGHAVYTEVMAHSPNPPRTSADNVAEVLDAVVRMMRKNPVAAIASQSQAAQPTKHTDLAKRLRAEADSPHASCINKSDLRAAADEIDRYYSGMLAWKQTAEKKDRDWNNERMGRVNDRIAERTSQATKAQAEPSLLRVEMPESSGLWPFNVVDEHGDVLAKFSYKADAEKFAAGPVASVAKEAEKEQQAKPELTVWYGSMPESNGKSNFTATLMRKGASWFDTNSYTFARSEYPDRVRYEADFMSYLIGERAERPEMWDKGYDFKRHSGYVAPTTQQAAKAESEQADFHSEVQALKQQMADAVIARGNLIEMLRILPPQGRFLEAAAAATVLAEIDSRPSDDHLWDATIRDRDTYHEWADKLAEAIGVHFGVDIGEHSNANLPWAEALEAIEGAVDSPYPRLAAVREWIATAPHGESCYLTDDPEFDRCRCGKEEVLAIIDGNASVAKAETGEQAEGEQAHVMPPEGAK